MKNIFKYTLQILIVIGSFFGFQILNAQNSITDSLENLLQNSNEIDTSRVLLLNETAFKLFRVDNSKALKYAEESKTLSQQLNYYPGEARSLQLIGIYYYFISDFTLALEYYNKALKIYEELGYERGISSCLNNSGIIYKIQGNYTKALEYYQKSLELYEKFDNKIGISKVCNNIGSIKTYQSNYPEALEYYQKSLAIKIELNNKKGISKAYNNIGNVYNKKGDYYKALEYYQKALELYEEFGDKSGVAISYNNLGLISRFQNNYSKALEYHYKSLKIREEINDKSGVSKSYNSIGSIHKYEGDYNKALEYFKKSLKIDEELGDKGGVSICYNNIGVVYINLNDNAKAKEYLQKSLELSIEIGVKSREVKNYIELGSLCFMQNRIKQAYYYSKKAYIISDKISEPELLKESSELLAKCSEALGLYKDAYKYHVVFKTMNDSLYNEKNVKKITGLEYQYKYDKEKQIAELKQQKKNAVIAEEKKQQKTIRNLFMIGFFLLLILLVVVIASFFQKRRANNRLASQKEEIQAQAEELANKNKELRELNSTKDKFFSIIAHDLKAPFYALLGFSNMLLEKHKSFDEEKREKYIRFINDSSKNTYKLLENLLTWSKSQKGIVEFSPEKINIKKLIDEVTVLLTEAAAKKSIKILANIENSLHIYADKNMIETVIRNLISNAIKFTSREGEISIDARLMINENEHDSIQISINDNGIGIEDEMQSKIFDISENTSTKGTENEVGTGLGLILCKEFVERHFGNIWVESKVGKGSSFYFTIPDKSKDYE